MSLKPQPAGPLPAETARVAHAAFLKGSPLLTLRDELGAVFRDEDFAVRARIDWKYLLRLDLSDPGFDASILVEFRDRLLEHGEEHILLDRALAACRERGLLKKRGRQRTDSTGR
jgi:transposase